MEAGGRLGGPLIKTLKRAEKASKEVQEALEHLKTLLTTPDPTKEKKLILGQIDRLREAACSLEHYAETLLRDFEAME